jgi:dTDP-4-amino-4,6-dideoxygalactose transaminase
MINDNYKGKPNPTYVTKPSLPKLQDLTPYLEQIWRSNILTNGGPLHQRLESELCDYLGVPYISLFNNGTIALATALQALELEGEVITTPFSFIATTNAVIWNGLKPVFVDIDPNTLNLAPGLIEAAITAKTTAILPVHCYGNPCDVDAIADIAQRRNLRVIYDAAHAFGVRCHCGSILNHGDLSVLSFHATKVFNTFEGGAIVAKSMELKQRIDQLRNFGLATERDLVLPGLNGKMSEINAAIGLCQLKYIDEYITDREHVDSIYREHLGNVKGISCLPKPLQSRPNFSYFPILVQANYPLSRDELLETLKRSGVMARRYFHPLLPDFYKSATDHEAPPILPHARRASETVICLPIFPALTTDEAKRISQIIASQK